MATFSHVLKFYESYLDFQNDTNVKLTVNTSNWYNQIYSYDLPVDRFGGCVEGTLNTSYNLATFIRNGWFLRYYANSGLSPWYVGTVEDISKRRRDNRAVIRLSGLVNKMNITPNQPEEFGNVSLDIAVEAMSSQARTDVNSIPGGTKTHHFTDTGAETVNADLELIPQMQWTWLPGDTFLQQMRLLEALTSKLCYGIAGDVGAVQTDAPTVNDSDFYAIWGAPPVRQWRIANEDFVLAREDERWSTIVNEFVLSWTNDNGEPGEYIYRDEGSIGQYGLRSKTVQLWPMTNQEALLWGGLFAKRYSTPTTTWELDLFHDDIEGSANNYTENSPPWPWYERVGIKDEMNGIVLDRAEVQSVRIRMNESGALSFGVVAGEDRSDLEDFAQSVRIATGNIDSNIPSGTSGAPKVGGCPSAYHSSADSDLSALEAPVAFPGALIDYTLYPTPGSLWSIPDTTYTTDRGESIDTSVVSRVPFRVGRTTQVWGWYDPAGSAWMKLVYPFFDQHYRDDPVNVNFEYSVPAHSQEIQWRFYNAAFYGWIYNPMMNGANFDMNTSYHVNWPASLCQHRHRFGSMGFKPNESNYANVNMSRWTGFGWGYDITDGGIADQDGRYVKDWLHAGLQFHLGLWVGAQPTPSGVTSYSGSPDLNDLQSIYDEFGSGDIWITRPVRKPYSIDTGSNTLPSISGITRAQVENSVFYMTDGGKAAAESAGYVLAQDYEWTGSGDDPLNATYSLMDPWPSVKKTGDQVYIDRVNNVHLGRTQEFNKHLFQVNPNGRNSTDHNDTGMDMRRGTTECHLLRKNVSIEFDSLTLIETLPYKRYFEYRVRGYDDTL